MHDTHRDRGRQLEVPTIFIRVSDEECVHAHLHEVRDEGEEENEEDVVL